MIPFKSSVCGLFLFIKPTSNIMAFGFNLAVGYRITPILEVLQIPKSTYYNYVNWQPSQVTKRRQRIKEKVLEEWSEYPMYGCPGLTILLYPKWQISVRTALVYRLMKELGISSIMVIKRKKPTSYTMKEKRLNLIKTG